MEDKRFIQFKCYLHELPLDGTWQCPDGACRAAHCPLCGMFEGHRCEHLLYTRGEWVYYVTGDFDSEDLPEPDYGWEAYEDSVILAALGGDQRLWDCVGPEIDILLGICELVIEELGSPVLRTWAGGWSPGSDAWANVWVQDGGNARSLLQQYVAVLTRAVTELNQITPPACDC